jgi:NADH-quinone oxidoreductase subunit J
MILFGADGSGFAKIGGLVRENWPVLLPAFLGFIGVYLLLPRVRRSAPILGGICAGAALLMAGWFAVRLEVVLPEKILFYAFAGSAVVGGIMLICQKNPVHAALSFALVILSTCGLFLLQAAPFLMAATIIIYAGAIVVTFLFVIMLAQQAGQTQADQRSREPFLASLACFVLMGAVLCVLHRNYDVRELDDLLAQVRQVAEARSDQEANAVLGDPARQPRENPTLPLVDRLSKYFPGEDAIANLEAAWQGIGREEAGTSLSILGASTVSATSMPLGPAPWLAAFGNLSGRSNLAKLQTVSRHILALGAERRLTRGTLPPTANIKLSTLSGVPPNAAFASTKNGTVAERLPARNVAGIGTALFSDYLVGVELAGVLLLVATIGAIAIAGRHAEVLR